ncbi:MAG TPA: SCO family protein [Luteitalea sp.]|nr:SCO family protein [Luteitalea sp.]
MTTRRLFAVFLVLVVTVVLVRTRGAASVDDTTQTFPVTGVVTAAPADGRVMVAHEEIRGYMPAMTMPFMIDASAPPAVVPGDRVRFVLRVSADASRAEAFEVVGHDAAVAAASRTAPAATGARLRRGDAMPSFALTTEAGAAFTNDDLRGRSTVLTFIFTRCPVPEFCPLMSKRFQQIQREVVADPALQNVRLVSITLDPAFDTPAVLAPYARAMGAAPDRWRFLTGSEAAIGALTRAFAVHTEKNGVFLDHTLATAVVGADGRIVEIWRGNGWSADEVVATLRESAAGNGIPPPPFTR